MAVAFLIRWLLDHLLGDSFAFLTLYGAVAIAVSYGGWRPALLAAVIGFLLENYFFILPRNEFVFDRTVWAGVLGYSLSCAVIIYLGDSLRRAKQRACTEITERKQTEEAVRRANERSAADLQAMTRLQEVGAFCAGSGSTFNECLDEVLEAAIALTGADKGNIQLIDESGVLKIVAHRGFDEPFLGFFATVHDEAAAVCGAAMRTAKCVIVEDVTRSEIFAGQPALDVLIQSGVGAVQSTPLISSAGKVLGIISTHFSRPHRPAERALQLMDLLARQAAEYLYRKRAEETLRKQAALLEAVNDNTTELIFMKDLAGRLTYANAATLRTIGRTREQATGSLDLENFQQPSEHAAISENDRIVAQTGRTVVAEEPYTCADGVRRVFLSTKSPLRDASGHTVGVIGVSSDITERKRAEEKLRAAEARLRALSDSAPVLIWQTDQTGAVFVNRHYLEFFGCGFDKIEGMGWAGFLHPEDRDAYLNAYLTAFKEERAYQFECRFRRHDGEWRWLHNTGTPHHEPEGKLLGYFGGSIDVTESKQAAEALRESQVRLSKEVERMSRLHTISVQMALTDDFQSLLQQILAAAADFMGTDKGNIQFLDSDTGELRIIVHQGLGKRFIEHFAEHGWQVTCDAALREGERVIVDDVANEPSIQGTIELEIVLEDDIRAIQSTPLVCRDGRLVGMLNNHFRRVHRPSEVDLRYLDLLARMAADLIDRVLAQERLRETQKQVRRARDYAEAALRTSPNPLLILQSDLRVVSGNEAFYEVFKVDPQETRGQSVYEVGNGQWNIPRVRELLEHILPHKHWVRGFEITHKFEIIGERTLLFNARGIEVEGALDRILLAIEDVTERKRVEAERERLLKAEQDLRHVAEEANRLKDEFLAIMSHELRNPLNVVLGYSELLLRSEEATRSPELLRTTEAIKRNALIQARLIRDLLDLSRLRSGKISLNTETVSLLVAVNHAVETVRSDADAKNIAIEVVIIGEPLFVEGDPVRLQQIVWNLLNNSIKFTPPNGRICVQLDSKDNQAVVSVQDTGTGIEPAFLPHVFEMFRQADARTNRPHSGMGIGLAVVHQLVDLHKGTINAFSGGSGKGATFTLQFPLSLEPRTLPGLALGVATALNNLSILVVDDSEDTTEMLTTLLSKKGAKVIPATSGNEALRVIAEREVDVVLSDISMPGMDGFEFLKRLRQIPGRTDVPVLALTGFGRPEDIERAKAEGFFSHVTKPFQLDALIGVLQQLPKRRH